MSGSIGLVLGLTAVLVAACSAAPVTTPSATATTGATSPASVTADPPGETPSGPLTFESTAIGKIPGAPYLTGALAFERGYLAWGTIDDVGTVATWYSADGATWAQSVHSTPIVPCPGYAARPDFGSVYDGASIGGGIVLAGGLAIPDDLDCDRQKAVAIATTDGTTWDRSAPFGPQRARWEWSQNVWAAPGGVEAMVESDQKPGTIWRSADGLAWIEVGFLEAPVGGQVGVYASSSDGTRLGYRSDPEGPGAVLASRDLVAWYEVTGLPTGFGIVGVIPPERAGGLWLLSMVRDDPEEARLVWSPNLVSWQEVTFPRPAIWSLVSTPNGFVAIGYSEQREVGCGDNCRPSDPALYASADGVTWTRQFDVGHEGARIVVGPAGTLLFESRDGVVVSRLTAGS